MINRLIKFQAKRKEFESGSALSNCLLSNVELRNEIEILSKSFFYKNVHGCSNCYMDAYVKLMNLKINDAMEKINCLFVLKAGALLQDFNDRKKTCSQANISNELALHHLTINPDCKKYFITLPDNLEQLLKDVQKPILREIEKVNVFEVEEKEEILTDEFSEEEETVINEIIDQLKQRVSKSKLKEKYNNLEMIGSKKVTGYLVTSLIKEASNRI